MQFTFLTKSVLSFFFLSLFSSTCLSPSHITFYRGVLLPNMISRKQFRLLQDMFFLSTIASFSCSLSCHHQLVLSSSLFPLNIFSLCFNAIISRTYMVFFFPLIFPLHTPLLSPIWINNVCSRYRLYLFLRSSISVFSSVLFCSLFFPLFPFLSLCPLSRTHEKKKNGHFCSNSY